MEKRDGGMTMNATRRLAVLVVLSFALRHSMHGQTTTNTDCNVYDNRVNCTSTSTDNSAAIRAQQERQAEQDKANEQAGAAVGKAMGTAMNGLMVGHKIKSYCKQHAGESYTWTWPDGRKQEGVCPGTLVVTKEKLIEASNSTFRAEKVVGYAESSGDTFTIHSERASDMRFHMILANKQRMESFRMAGIKTFVYTNDSDQRFTYDLVADHVVTPGVPSPAPAAVPAALAAAPAATPSAPDEAESSVDAVSSDTATKAVASNIPQGAPAAAPAVSTTATGTADIPKPCFTDKSGHTVCLAQH